MKVVSLENLNGFIVNNTFEMIANEMGAKAAEEKPRLVRLVLRNSAEPKIPTGVPLVSFVKNLRLNGEIVVVVFDVATGAIQLIDGSYIASETNVKGNFKIAGVTYGIKDTVNGIARYHRVVVPRKRPRKKVQL
ncbi:MAG: hypothetical protein IJ564_04030 [Alphaproteobacteria bacterium]|nr:hypothetical protein [Alphaproteobacteria bacterium]